jgi:catechol 2,3-dioxygenase-like lactoylglutathione lyase family enzyme
MNNLLTILYVADQQKSTTFYQEVLLISPSLNVPGMTEFTLFENCKLGLMPENGIAEIITPASIHPKEGSQIPRCEIYLRRNKPQEYMNRAIDSGAKIISPLQNRDWGEKVGYVADLDGHILAFAEKL